MQRGEVWWASLADPRGSQAGFRHPVLVVQADSFNRSNISTVLVLVITSNLRLASAPGNVRLRRSDCGLPRESVINVSQVVTVDKRFLTERVGRVPPEVLAEVGSGLRLILGLGELVGHR
ncbi:MAG: type II toxin-antitoxin system PemK/MazF family toxin [Chloroflexi bacterium]|nr:type II toxin-antitoxin system PemK/MazF family toxin [Chloroflexota bacterium]